MLTPTNSSHHQYVTMCPSHCGIYLGSSHKALYSRMHWCVIIYWIATCHMIYQNIYHSALYSVCMCVHWKPGSRLPSSRLVLYLSCYICRHYRNLSHHCTVWRVEAETKWQPFCRNYSQMHFIKWKHLNAIKIALQFVPKDPANNITGSDSCLAPSTWQAVISTNVLLNWRTSASPDLSQLSIVLLYYAVHN